MIAIPLGLIPTLPGVNEDWIEVFDKGNLGVAPGGGPAYLPGKPKKSSGSTLSTGAVYVDYNAKKAHIDIRRPNYLTLEPFRARIYRDSIELKQEKN